MWSSGLCRISFFILSSFVIFYACFRFSRDRSLQNNKLLCEKLNIKLTADVQNVYSDDCIGDNISTVIDQKVYLHKMDGTTKGGVLGGIFSMLHHPGMPVTTELVYTKLSSLSNDFVNRPYDNCNQMFLTRTGSLKRMPNKCLAIVMLEDGFVPNPSIQSHRVGVVANLSNMYQPDYIDGFSLDTEKELLPLFIRNIDILTSQIIAKMGDPILPNGERRTITILVANEGVVDLVLNFVCSCRAARIDTSGILVFLGSPDLQPLLEGMGLKSFFHEALGPIPKVAAGNYGDNTFGILMWLKTTSIYIASHAGYDILFQDADLVWISDPLPHLRESIHDIAFMDDGARTPRFTPFFVNSGFYYQKHNDRTLYLMEKMAKAICEISITHSHQATLTRHITEAHHLMGLQVVVLEQKDFPSGMVYHHDKKFIADIKAHRYTPKVFHMCWTQSREEKVTYFKDIGLWFLPENTTVINTDNVSSVSDAVAQNDAMCVDPKLMLVWMAADETRDILKACCQPGDYWK